MKQTIHIPGAPKRKKKSGISSVMRTLKRLRDDGWLCAVVEHLNPHVKIRQDLFGIVDILALKPGEGTLAVQVCQGKDKIEHVYKVEMNPKLDTLVGAGWNVEIWAWTPHKIKRGGNLFRHDIEVVPMTKHVPHPDRNPNTGRLLFASPPRIKALVSPPVGTMASKPC